MNLSKVHLASVEDSLVYFHREEMMMEISIIITNLRINNLTNSSNTIMEISRININPLLSIDCKDTYYLAYLI